jgi:lysophospholipase L1-like esterase
MKKLLVLFALSTAGWAQQAPYYPSQGGASLPTATAPGQVITSTGPGNSYSAVTPAGVSANLPGSPNTVYSFVATGDQTGTTIHDISGNGFNATINRATDGGANYWTGTGWTPSAQSAYTYATLNAGNITDQTYCLSMYIPFYNLPGNNSVNQLDYLTDVSGQGFTGNQSLYGASAFVDITFLGNEGGAYNFGPLPMETGFHTKCWVMGKTANSTQDQIFNDGIEENYVARNGPNGTHQSGNWVLGQPVSANATATWYYFAAWPQQLTSAQIQQASIAMTQAVSARGVPVTPPSPTTTITYIRAVGDSITCCAGAVTTQWYPTLLSVNAAYSSVYNAGEPGFPAMSFAEFARWKDGPSCNTGTQPSMVTVFGGTNDGYFTATAPVTYAALQGMARLLHGLGCQVGVATMISRTALDTFKDQLNPLIRAGASQGNYFLIDTAAIPALGADGDYSNTTYFNTDQVHPTNAGQTLLATAFSDAINAYGIGAATAAAPTVYSSNAVTMASPDVFATIIPTAAATATLPDCLGVTGTVYQITNSSAGAFTITFSGKTSEAITGSATLAQNVVGRFQATLISQAAAGCGWQRIQ